MSRIRNLRIRIALHVAVAALACAGLLPAVSYLISFSGHRIGFVVAGFILAILIVWFSVRRIQAQIDIPVRRFIDSAKQIARGNFDHRVDVSSSEGLDQLAKIFNYMTLELKRITDLNINQIIREQIKIETIIRNIADGVIVSGPFDEVLLVNNVVEKWFNIREKDVLACSLTYFIPDMKPLLDLAKQAEPEVVIHHEITIPSVNTKGLILAANASKVYDDRELIGIVIILRNVTKEKEVDRLKTELVSVVAHELRSPLTSIAGFSEVVAQEKDLAPSRRQEYMEIIRAESRRLADLIDKFLNISRMESGQTPIHMIPLELNGLVSNVLEIHRTQAERKNIRVEFEADPDIPTVMGDPDLLGQVVLNLFSNAIKYSPQETTIRVVVARTTDSALIRIRDEGFGMSKENLNRLFTKFFRAKDDKRLQDIEGTGLGLAFVKEIVLQHGGKVVVESELGKGSMFTVYLPLASTPVEHYA